MRILPNKDWEGFIIHTVSEQFLNCPGTCYCGDRSNLLFSFQSLGLYIYANLHNKKNRTSSVLPFHPNLCEHIQLLFFCQLKVFLSMCGWKELIAKYPYVLCISFVALTVT